MNYKHLVFLFIFSSPAFFSYAKVSQAENSAIASIKAIFPTLSNSSKVKTKGCQFQKEKWMSLLLTQVEFEEKLSFNKECDLQGTFTAKMNKSFPLSLKVRNLNEYSSLTSKILLKLIFEEKPYLSMNMDSTTLKGKKDLVFTMNYGVYIDPMAADPLKNHKGGELFIKRHGKDVLNKKIPLNFTD